MVAVNSDDYGRRIAAVHEFHALIDRFRNTSSIDRDQEKYNIILIEKTGKHRNCHIKNLRAQIVDNQFCYCFRSSSGAEIYYVRIHMGFLPFKHPAFRQNAFPSLMLTAEHCTRDIIYPQVFL